MDVKRRRSETRLNDIRNAEGGKERDVYDEATDSSSTARASLFTEVRSSWLRETQWASNHSVATANDTTGCWTRERESFLSQEINSLQQQLSQVKRRLLPAAERSTESSNSHHNSPSRGTTTGRQEFAEARRACNPYEVLGEGHNGGLNSLFMNRSAVKLANIDAMLNFVVSDPIRTNDGNQNSGSFSFVDLCAAPGGFSEYLGQRCHANELSLIRGYGMSLLTPNEYGAPTSWKMQDSEDASEEGFYSQYRVCEGEDGTGDILNWDNILALKTMIELDSHTVQPPDESVPLHNDKVDLVVADGGFDAQRDANHQEQIAQKLVLCEFAAGLLLLKPEGQLVVKMFGFQTDVTRTMLKDVYLMFDDFIALKPISSRPASAERYVVFKGFRGIPEGWNGPKWISRILLGSLTMTNASDEGLEDERLVAFETYLDKFDRSMASLNLKACFSILSFLENKCLAIASPTYDGSEHSRDFDDAPLVDVEAYKVAWRLM